MTTQKGRDMTTENLEALKAKVEQMDSNELISLINMAFNEPNFNPTMLKILKTYLSRALRKEGYL